MALNTELNKSFNFYESPNQTPTFDILKSNSVIIKKKRPIYPFSVEDDDDEIIRTRVRSPVEIERDSILTKLFARQKQSSQSPR